MRSDWVFELFFDFFLAFPHFLNTDQSNNMTNKETQGNASKNTKCKQKHQMQVKTPNAKHARQQTTERKNTERHRKKYTTAPEQPQDNLQIPQQASQLAQFSPSTPDHENRHDQQHRHDHPYRHDQQHPHDHPYRHGHRHSTSDVTSAKFPSPRG